MCHARSATSSGSLRKGGIWVRSMQARSLMVSGALFRVQVGPTKFAVP
jgi:hypothetical protein